MSSVLIVEPISSGLNLISASLNMGLEVVVLSQQQGDCGVPSEFLQKGVHLEICDTNFEAEALACTQRLDKNYRFQAVLPGFEYYVPLATQIAASLNLKGLDPAFVEDVRFKHKMRQRLYESNVRVPRFYVVDYPDDVSKAIQKVGLPAVIKPVDASGSLHVQKVESIEEAQMAFAIIQNTKKIDCGRSAMRKAVIEEYLDGDEISVEGFMEGDEPVFLSVTEKLLGAEPHFVETGHIVGKHYPKETMQAIFEYLKKALKALHVCMGPFHAELRLTQDGPVLIEVGARLAGDRICDLIRIAKNVDLYQIMLRCYLGLTNTGAVRNGLVAGVKFFIRPSLNYFKLIQGVEEVQRLPGYREIQFNYQPGNRIPPAENFMGRLGHVIFAHEQYDQLKLNMDKADQLLEFSGMERHDV